MHELSIAAYLLEAVDAHARGLGAERVRAINLLVGERAGIMDDSLRFSFELLATETLAEGAQLNVRRTPMLFRCAACDDEYEPGIANFRCPVCGGIGQMVDGGNDLMIESIEIEI